MKIVKKLKEMGVRGYKISVIFEHDDRYDNHSTMDLFVDDWDEDTLISLYKLFKYAQYNSYSDIFYIHESYSLKPCNLKSKILAHASDLAV
jgi:hypothetical protein